MFFSRKNCYYLFFLIFFFLLCAPAFSQEDNDDESVYVINSFEFNITGKTRPSALIRKGELKTGEEFTGLSELEKYIQDKTQLLYNERVLDSVSIDYSIGQRQDDGKFPVDVIINTKDTWNIVAVPRPRYSSNTGFDITLKARNYNFFGTMDPLRLDLGYSYDENLNHSFFFLLDSNIPFTVFGLNWNIKFYNDFSYRHGAKQPFYNGNTTGLSVDLPISSTTLTVGLNESFIFNKENEDIYKEEYGDYQDGFYMSTNPYVSWKIPIGVDAGSYGEIDFIPGISLSIPHEFSRWPLDDIAKGPFLEFSQVFGFSKIDWIDNFRKGLDVSLNNSLTINFHKLNKNKNPWEDVISISGTGHFKIAKFFGISTKLAYRQWFLSDYGYTQAGDALRGVIDKNISSDCMFSFNLDLQFRLFKFLPSVWLNKSKLRVFNFEFFTAPFVDVAVYHDSSYKNDFNLKNIAVSGGLEFIIFPEFFRSLFLRVSLGWNLRKKINYNNMEIYIGTDFFY